MLHRLNFRPLKYVYDPLPDKNQEEEVTDISELDRPNDIDLATDHTYPTSFGQDKENVEVTENIHDTTEETVSPPGDETQESIWMKECKQKYSKNYGDLYLNDLTRKNPELDENESNRIHECYLCEDTTFDNKHLLGQHVMLFHFYQKEHRCPMQKCKDNIHFNQSNFQHYYNLLELACNLYLFKWRIL